MKAMGLALDVIVTSPSGAGAPDGRDRRRRAGHERATGRGRARLAHGFDAGACARSSRGSPGRRPCMVVGHEPDFSADRRRAHRRPRDLQEGRLGARRCRRSRSATTASWRGCRHACPGSAGDVTAWRVEAKFAVPDAAAFARLAKAPALGRLRRWTPASCGATATPISTPPTAAFWPPATICGAARPAAACASRCKQLVSGDAACCAARSSKRSLAADVAAGRVAGRRAARARRGRGAGRAAGAVPLLSTGAAGAARRRRRARGRRAQSRRRHRERPGGRARRWFEVEVELRARGRRRRPGAARRCAARTSAGTRRRSRVPSSAGPSRSSGRRRRRPAAGAASAPCTRPTPPATTRARSARWPCSRSTTASRRSRPAARAGLSDAPRALLAARYRARGRRDLRDLRGRRRRGAQEEPGGAPAEAAADPATTEEAPRHPARRHHGRGGRQDAAFPLRAHARARGRHPPRRRPGGAARHARLHAPHAHGAARLRGLPRPRGSAAGAQGSAPHRAHARRRARPRRLPEKTQHYLDTLPAERGRRARRLCSRPGSAERERQRAHLLDYLDGSRYRALRRRTSTSFLDGPLERLAPRARQPIARPQRVAQVLPGVLLQGHGRRLGLRGPAGRPRDAAAALPRACARRCKGLRYTLEFFEEVLGPGARPLIKTVKGLQDHLGDLQDAVVTSGVLRDFITWGTWRHSGHDLPGSCRSHRGAGSGSVPRRPPGGDGATRPDLPRGVADARGQRLQPRTGHGDRRRSEPGHAPTLHRPPARAVASG